MWRGKWQPTPVFLPGESHGWRSVVGYHSWVAKSWTWRTNTLLYSSWVLKNIVLKLPPQSQYHPIKFSFFSISPLLPNLAITNLFPNILKMKVTQSCPTLCDPMDYTVPGILQARVLECLSLLQGILPTQGSSPGLPHCRWFLYHRSPSLLSLYSLVVAFCPVTESSEVHVAACTSFLLFLAE